jgi:archaellum component FlaC
MASIDFQPLIESAANAITDANNRIKERLDSADPQGVGSCLDASQRLTDVLVKLLECDRDQARQQSSNKSQQQIQELVDAIEGGYNNGKPNSLLGEKLMFISDADIEKAVSDAQGFKKLISDSQSQVAELSTSVNELTTEKAADEATINDLKNQTSALQTKISELVSAIEKQPGNSSTPTPGTPAPTSAPTTPGAPAPTPIPTPATPGTPAPTPTPNTSSTAPSPLPSGNNPNPSGPNDKTDEPPVVTPNPSGPAPAPSTPSV